MADLVHRSEGALSPTETTASIVDVLARAAKDPTVDVAKLERLIDLQQRVLADQRRTAYYAALARLQARLPQIAKSGMILDANKQIRNRYAKVEDIDAVIRPLCAEEGFSFSFDSADAGAKGATYTCAMHHSEGHTEEKRITVPLDTGAGRNAIQSVGSSTSYARRYLLSMHLHLITRDEDDDGNGGSEPVTAEQAATLRRDLSESSGSEAKFLRWLGVDSFEAILSRDFDRARKAIDERKRAKS